MNQTTLLQDSKTLKTCCANLYQSNWATWLLGESFHPGGLALTQRLGELLRLKPGMRVLDVAGGRGTSAIFLAQHFGCEVVGVDFGAESVALAREAAKKAGLSHLLSFQKGDAERLPFTADQFDAVICECAFCTFPNKSTAALEFARVLKPGGKLGLSDLTRTGTLPPELDTLLAWLACIADAQPLERYILYLEEAGFLSLVAEEHNDALAKMVNEVRGKLLGAEILLKTQNIHFEEAENLQQAKMIARHAAKAVQDGKLGYSLLVGEIRF